MTVQQFKIGSVNGGYPIAIPFEDAPPTGFNVDNFLKQLMRSYNARGAGTGTSSIPGVSATLPGAGYRFSDLYKPPTSTVSDRYFQDYLGKIMAPSSVNQVQSEINSQTVDQLLAQIDRDTAQSLASSKLDFLDRGLGGPGQISEIEAAAAGGIRSNALTSKTNARLGFANAELMMQKAREDAERKAYETRYGVGVAADTTAADVAARGVMSDQQTLNQLLGIQYQGGITAGEGAATRANAFSMNSLNQILEALLKSKGLDLTNSQFYAGLSAREKEAALERDLKSFLGQISRPETPNVWADLGGKILGGAAGGLTGAVTGHFLS